MAAALQGLEGMLHELTASRYMSGAYLALFCVELRSNAEFFCIAVGLMVLLYDHVLTFGDEVQYVWSAPATYAKYIFLLNRYVVLGTLLAVAYGEQNSRVMGTCVSTMIHRDVRLRGFNVHRRGMYCFNLYPGHVIILNIILIAQGSVSMNIWTVDSVFNSTAWTDANNSYSHVLWWQSSRSVLPTF